jgi:cytoskeletal protein RodZ
VTLGQHLKNRRQELGRSLEQVSALTRIHIKILTAIEEDLYSELPARAFTRGFIVNYAKALKLEPNQILSTFHDFLEEKFSERPDRDLGHQGYAFEGKELEQNRRWMMFGGGLAAVFALAVLLIFKPENHKRKEKHKEFEAEVDETAGIAPAIPMASPGQSPGIVTAANSVQISFSNLNSGPISTSNPLPGMGSLSGIAPGTSSSSGQTQTPAAPAASATPSATPAPVTNPTTAPTLAPVAAPSTTASPTPAASPSESATPKPDLLNKGDSLTPEEVKVKATFQAKEDAWIRYRSDDLPSSMMILRKGRTLVIKGKSRILFETNKTESLQIKSQGSFQDLSIKKGSIEPKSAPKAYEGSDMGSRPLPEQIPAPKAQ